ncbi:MAG: 2'-5' RNA ligase family protein [Rhizobacter sp.]|nr:2'-5' RNA ligase family protein [Rhizobacter sp.]
MGAADRLSLSAAAALPKATDRLFFALFPPPEAASSIAAVAQQVRGELGLKGQPLSNARLHVTLHYLGDHAGLPSDIVDSARVAASQVAGPPFEVCFDHVASFAARTRKRPCVLLGNGPGVEPIKAFQRQLGEALKRTAPGGRAAEDFTPHVTLLYDDQAVADHSVDPICWTAREFVLVHSLIGQRRHAVLGRWPLSPIEGPR